MLEPGMKAPEFTLKNQEGKEVSLSDYRGKKVILYFYSKDNTAGCTNQACSFAELYPAFIEKNGFYTECWGVLKSTLPTFFSL